MVGRASSLVVLGSSPTVMSGLRYVRHAAKSQVPVVIVNQGSTRGDAYAAATLDAPQGQVLTTLVAGLRPAETAPLPLTEGAGVGGRVDLAEPVHRDQRVDLRGGDRRVAQQFLDDADVGPAVQHVGGE
jgi:hypothetical protein